MSNVISITSNAPNFASFSWVMSADEKTVKKSHLSNFTSLHTFLSVVNLVNRGWFSPDIHISLYAYDRQLDWDDFIENEDFEIIGVRKKRPAPMLKPEGATS